MARKSALVVAGVNIAAEPPHSPNLYKDVITYIKNNKIIGIFGNERLEIESFSIDYENYIIDGTFSRYSYIDPQKPWWDSNRGQKILDEQGNPIPQVEEGKGPNQKSILFSFNLNNHKLLIDEKNITINSFKKAFESMLCNKNLTDTFGTINITKIPTQDIITYILSIHKLKKIYFKLTIPNPDLTSNPQLEADIFQRFQNINAGSIEGSITSQKNEEVAPDESLKAMLVVASRNGFVETKGKDENGEKDERSTREHPKRARTTYEASWSRKTVFSQFVRSLFQSF